MMQGQHNILHSQKHAVFCANGSLSGAQAIVQMVQQVSIHLLP